jgi:MinD-like ATPase involved in chromosome partitioning or flagellar assembly
MDRVSKAFLNTRIAYAGSIPFDVALPASVRRREPVTIGTPYAPSSKAIRRLAAKLMGEPDAAPTDVRKGFLGRLAGFLAQH